MRPRSSTSGLPPLPLLALLPLPLTACLSKPGPPASCTDGRCLTVLAEEPGAGELVIDRDTAYWTINSLAGSIRACAVDNCAPHDLAPEQKAPHSLLVEGEDAIWASGSELYRVNRDRAPLQPVVQIDSNGVNPVHMFRHPLRYLYWSSDRGLWRCDYDATETCTAKMALPMLEAFGGPLALDGNDQLWITGDDQMAAYSLTAQTIRARFPVGGIRALVANDTHVFALRPDAAEVLALSVTASENTPPTPIRTGGMPRSLALDGTALFVADQAGRIVRVPVFPDLGAPEELAIGLPPIETIAVADDRIYLIIDGGRIAYLPKR